MTDGELDRMEILLRYSKADLDVNTYVRLARELLAGIRPRVWVNKSTLSDFLNAIVDARLTLRHIEEPGDDDYPLILGVAAER